MMYQNSSNAVGASNNLGGSNAKQVGLGASVGSIDRVMGQGMMQPTGRPLDLAMDGEGFFMVAKGPVAHKDGDITIDQDGKLDAGGIQETDRYLWILKDILLHQVVREYLVML